LVYKVLYKSSVRKDLKKIERSAITRILQSIEESLSVNPYAGKRLTGKYEGLYSYRVGRYRVIYTIVGDEVWILKIGHRKHVYRP